MEKTITQMVRLIYYLYNLTNADLKMKLTVFLLVISLFKLQANAHSENNASDLPGEIDYMSSDVLLLLAKTDGFITINASPPPIIKPLKRAL